MLIFDRFFVKRCCAYCVHWKERSSDFDGTVGILGLCNRNINDIRGVSPNETCEWFLFREDIKLRKMNIW